MVALRRLAVGFVVCSIAALEGPEAPALDARDLQKDFVEAVKKVSPAVVHIRVEKTGAVSGEGMDPFEYFFGGRRAPRYYRQEGMGSGVIVRPDGVILTNSHVVADATALTVRLASGRTYTAKLVGADSATDIAVIRIGGAGHPHAAIGDSDGVESGQWALALGNPFGLDHSVSLGIVSARGRRGLTGEGYEDYIQTDAAVNPGNSGGPLVNIDGEIIGINSMIFSRTGGYQGIGFAVPSNLAKLVMERLLAEGRVRRAWLGVVIQDMTPDLAPMFGVDRPGGAVLTQVVPGSPAEKAGLVAGDVVARFEGTAVNDANDLRNRVAHTPVGTRVALTVLRGRKETELRVKLDEHPGDASSRSAPPAEEPARAEGASLGLRLQPMTPDIARELGQPDSRGLLVVRVRAGSPAESAGIEPGEVVLEANRKAVDSLDGFTRVVKSLGPGDALLLLVRERAKAPGEPGTRFVVVRP